MKGHSKLRKQRIAIKKRDKGFNTEFRNSHFFHGQTPHTPPHDNVHTFCSGYTKENGTHHSCKIMMEPKLGVFQPRCPKCYGEFIRISQLKEA